MDLSASTAACLSEVVPGRQSSGVSKRAEKNQNWPSKGRNGSRPRVTGHYLTLVGFRHVTCSVQSQQTSWFLKQSDVNPALGSYFSCICYQFHRGLHWSVTIFGWFTDWSDFINLNCFWEKSTKLSSSLTLGGNASVRRGKEALTGRHPWRE